MKLLDSYGPLLARILIASIFIVSGTGKIAGFESTVAYIASKGLPLASLGAIGALILEIAGGLAIIVGYKVRWVALALSLFCIATAILFHNFWASPPADMQNQMFHFMKNFSMAGGLLFVAVHGAGRRSID